MKNLKYSLARYTDEIMNVWEHQQIIEGGNVMFLLIIRQIIMNPHCDWVFLFSIPPLHFHSCKQTILTKDLSAEGFIMKQVGQGTGRDRY